jgi:hypothetical protein
MKNIARSKHRLLLEILLWRPSLGGLLIRSLIAMIARVFTLLVSREESQETKNHEESHGNYI